MKRTAHEVNARGSGGNNPEGIIRPPNQRVKLATGAALLLLLQLSATNALAAPTTIAHPDYTTPIIAPQTPAGAWTNVIPNALSAGFTYTPYASGTAGANAFSAVDPSASCGVNEDCYTITIQQAVQQTGLIDNGTAGNPLLPTTIWAYGSATNGGSVWHAPAKTFRTTSNKPARITWLNQLPNIEPPGFDPTYCGPSAPDCYPYNRIVTHVHGAHVSDDSDGIPEAWYSANFADTGSVYKPSTYGPLGTYRYPNTQEAGTIWYHDHATGQTHLNVQMGMAGFYLITDDNEKTLQGLPPGNAGTKVLPTDPYEIGFALQDRTFWPNGDFALPDQPIRDLLSLSCVTDPATGLIDPLTCPTVPFSKAADGHLIPFSPTAPTPGPFTAKSGTLEYFGNIPMVNGVVYGTYPVERRVYRMRFIGGTDSRTFVLQLEDRAAPGTPIPFWQIGTDQGMLNNPVSRNTIDLMPGERVDVLVNLKNIPGGSTRLVLKNLGPDMPYEGLFANPAQPVSTDIPEIMEFNLVALSGVADVPSPTAGLNLRPVNGPIAQLTPTPTTPVRNISLMEITDHYGRTMPTIDSRGFMEMGMAPTEIVKLNDIEQWDIINTTVDAHPMHLHLVAFQLINRQLIDPATFVPPVSDTMNQIYKQPSYTNAAASTPILPSATPWEAGWKDTIDCPPGYVTRVKAKFDIEGAYVWHCHILSHEEHDMMRPMMVHKRRINADFDGDGKTDIAFWDPNTGDWKINASFAMVPYMVNYGTVGDKPVPGDYDGSGKNEIAVFRPSNGTWYIRNTDGTQTVVNYGINGDIPVPGDFDGDGKTDIAVWRTGNWFVKNSATSTQRVVNYGTAGDLPVPGDFDGDGKTDIAVWRSSDGGWYVINSASGTQTLAYFGIAADIPVPGDYDGDGKTDVAIYRPSTFTWFIKNSATGTQTVKIFGTTGDVPMPGDYGNIGRTDIAVWRPSTGSMYIIDSASGTQLIVPSGSVATDLPIKSGQPIQ